MKVYISSGKITGLEPEIVKRNFEHAMDTVRKSGYKPVSPYLKNGHTANEPWTKHMAKDIVILMGCDAIYMQDNWHDSKDARIEHVIAKEMGLQIFYQTEFDGSTVKINMIKDAIFEATGSTFDQYIIKSRKQEMYFRRLIFIYQCKRFAKIENSLIASIIGRDESNIRQSWTKYDNERKFNKRFRTMADNVETILSKYVSQ